MISEEDFEMWLENPATQAVFIALGKYREALKQAWFDQSWNKGDCDERSLADIRARAEMLSDIVTIDFETYEGFANMEEKEGFEENDTGSAEGEGDQQPVGHPAD